MSLLDRAKIKGIRTIHKFTNPDRYLDKIIPVNQMERDLVIDNIYSVNNNGFFYIARLVRKNGGEYIFKKLWEKPSRELVGSDLIMNDWTQSNGNLVLNASLYINFENMTNSWFANKINPPLNTLISENVSPYEAYNRLVGPANVEEISERASFLPEAEVMIPPEASAVIDNSVGGPGLTQARPVGTFAVAAPLRRPSTIDSGFRFTGDEDIPYVSSAGKRKTKKYKYKKNKGKTNKIRVKKLKTRAKKNKKFRNSKTKKY